MSDEGKGVVELAVELQETRQQLRDTQKEASKVSAVRRENAHLSRKHDKAKGRVDALTHMLAEKEAKIAELEAQLRAQEDLEREIQQAEADRADALGEKEKAQEELLSAQKKLSRLAQQLDSAHKEIGRLKRHEEHTGIFNRLVELTKELT